MSMPYAQLILRPIQAPNLDERLAELATVAVSTAQETGVAAELVTMDVAGGPGTHPFTNAEAAAAFFAEHRNLELRDDRPPGAGASLRLFQIADSMTVSYTVQGQAFERRCADLIDDARAYGVRCLEALPDDAVVGRECVLSVHAMFEPPPGVDWFHDQRQRVMQFFSHRFYAANKPAAWPMISTTPLPPQAQREVRQDLVVVRWAESLADPDAVREGATAELMWRRPSYKLPVPRENEPVLWVGAEERQGVFSYSVPFQGVLLAATVHQGALEPGVAAQAHELVQAGELSDGSPVRSVDLVLPSREAALQVRAEAEGIGVRRTLYADDEGLFWPRDEVR